MEKERASFVPSFPYIFFLSRLPFLSVTVGRWCQLLGCVLVCFLV